MNTKEKLTLITNQLIIISTKIKLKGEKTYKCTNCTACFTIEAMDNCTKLNFCPTCGKINLNLNTVNLFN